MRLHRCYNTCDEYNQLWAEYQQAFTAYGLARFGNPL
jgi:hypothetical protein